MPFKYTKTTPANLPWGKSVRFNGTNQYLTTANVSNFVLTGDFTTECFVNLSALPTTQKAIINYWNAASNNRSIYWNLINSGGAVTMSFGLSSDGTSANSPSVDNGWNPALNTWYHIAVSRKSNIVTMFVNGTQLGTTQSLSISNKSVAAPLAIGADYPLLSAAYYFNGYISNLRIVNGTALYTSSFTVPTSPLNVVASASLLACHDTSIKDGSVNNFAITNNNTATVSTATPFVVSTNSVLFNGSTQYLSLSRVLDNSTDFTVEAWVRVNSTPPVNSGYIVSQYVSAGADRTIFSVRADLTVLMQFGATNVGSTTVLALNNWYHLAFVRSGSGANNCSIYINGVRDGQLTYTGTFQNTPTTIGGSNNLASTYFPGYISNLRIVKGTALYTASFTALAEPLTSVASCSLLTCNAPTIVDSSNNNFTITNNGSATVSSVVPFNAVGYGYKFKNVNNAASVSAGTQKAIFGYGTTGTNTAITNLVSNTGVVATDTTGVGTARLGLAAAGYGTDKAIFGYGRTGGNVSITNLVSNTGIVSTDTTGVGTVRYGLAAACYGTDKAIFGYGINGSAVSLTNLVSNTGVVSTDTTGVGTARYWLAAAGYGGDKAIFGYGTGPVSLTNLVSNTGVVASDTIGVGTARSDLAAAGYGGDKAIFGYGYTSTVVSITNKVSNTGVVSTDTTGVGTARSDLAAAGYGVGKAIFGYGYISSNPGVSLTNLVSDTGIVATDTTGVGTGRQQLAAAGSSVTTVPAPSGMNFKKVYPDPVVVYLTQKAIFGYGNNGATNYSITNLVSNTGVVATDTTGVGTGRNGPAAAGYGTDKAIFGYGTNGGNLSMTNLVSNAGVVATDTTGVGTARCYLAASGYGIDKAIFGYGNDNSSTYYSLTNLVSNTGVVATDTAGVGTSRRGLAAAGYGTGKSIFGYGTTGTNTAVTNLVSNTGVVATDTTGVGTARAYLAAAGYGTDKAIFGYGTTGTRTAITNLVSNTGVVATDTTGVGTGREVLAAAGYGSDKSIFGYGQTTVALSMTNLVSNTGVVATDTTGVGTARNGLAAAGYSLT
jgi:hypothetical protein